MKNNVFKILILTLFAWTGHSAADAQVQRYVTAAQLHISVTHHLVFSAYLNGTEIISSGDHLNDPTADINQNLNPKELCLLTGDNFLAISVDQILDASAKTNSTIGMAYVLKVTLSDNTILYFTSSEGKQTKQFHHAGSEPNGWFRLDFDDTSWNSAVSYNPASMATTLLDPQTNLMASYFKTFEDGSDDHMRQTMGERIFFRRAFALDIGVSPACGSPVTLQKALPLTIVPVATATHTFTPTYTPTLTIRPLPTDTSVPPTSTFTPTATFTWTPVPPAIATPTYTSTAMPQATATPIVPTFTSTPIPPVNTNTPLPTWTPRPLPTMTFTPIPAWTATPTQPIWTPVPTKPPALLPWQMAFLAKSASVAAANRVAAPTPVPAAAQPQVPAYSSPAASGYLPPVSASLPPVQPAYVPKSVAAPAPVNNYYQPPAQVYQQQMAPPLAPLPPVQPKTAYVPQSSIVDQYAAAQPQAKGSDYLSLTADAPTPVPRPAVTFKKSVAAIKPKIYEPPTSTPTDIPEPTDTSTPVPVRKKHVVVRTIRRVPPTPTATATPGIAVGAGMIAFSSLPVNINASFGDGPGVYQCEVVDAKGNHVNMIFNKRVSFEKETWISWDATNDQGQQMKPGIYFAILTKEGRLIRKIPLNWAGPGQ